MSLAKDSSWINLAKPTPDTEELDKTKKNKV